MHSALYSGYVRHTRYVPRRHAFRYRLFLFYLDLDELPAMLDRLWFCSHRRPAPIRFRREDHVGPHALPLKQAVQRKVRELGGPELQGRVCLLTHLRFFGYGFNPVSFYYCHDDQDRPQVVLAEVNNTPWGERHYYLVPLDVARPEHPKAFRVSPFLDMNMRYRWAMRAPGERLTIHIENLRDSERLFDAALALRREPLTGVNLARRIFRHPFMPLRVIGAIYFQALRLWLKRVPLQLHAQTPPASQPAPAAARRRL